MDEVVYPVRLAAIGFHKAKRPRALQEAVRRTAKTAVGAAPVVADDKDTELIA